MANQIGTNNLKASDWSSTKETAQEIAPANCKIVATGRDGKCSSCSSKNIQYRKVIVPILSHTETTAVFWRDTNCFMIE